MSININGYIPNNKVYPKTGEQKSNPCPGGTLFSIAKEDILSGLNKDNSVVVNTCIPEFSPSKNCTPPVLPVNKISYFTQGLMVSQAPIKSINAVCITPNSSYTLLNMVTDEKNIPKNANKYFDDCARKIIADKLNNEANDGISGNTNFTDPEFPNVTYNFSYANTSTNFGNFVSTFPKTYALDVNKGGCTQYPSPPTNSALSTGAIVGISVGGFFGVVGLGLIIYYCVKKCREEKEEQLINNDKTDEIVDLNVQDSI